MEFDYKILAKYIIGEITFEEQTSLVEWSQMSEENKGKVNVTFSRALRDIQVGGNPLRL